MKLLQVLRELQEKTSATGFALAGGTSLALRFGHYQAKYQPASLMMVIRSLAWFDDADAEPDPVTLCNAAWPAVKDQIAIAIRGLS